MERYSFKLEVKLRKMSSSEVRPRMWKASVMKSWLKIKVRVIKKFQKKETGLDFNLRVRLESGEFWRRLQRPGAILITKYQGCMHAISIMSLSGWILYPLSTACHHPFSSLSKTSYNFEATHHPLLVSLDQNQDVSRAVFFSKTAKMVSILFAVQLLEHTHWA